MSQATFTLHGHNPDVLTCIANLSNDEVFTPPEFANQMLDTLCQGVIVIAFDDLELFLPNRVVLWREQQRQVTESLAPSSIHTRLLVGPQC